MRATADYHRLAKETTVRLNDTYHHIRERMIQRGKVESFDYFIGRFNETLFHEGSYYTHERMSAFQIENN